MEIRIFIKNSVLFILCAVVMLYITKNTELAFALFAIAITK